MSDSYICAAGDSFVFGAELVSTHCKDQIAKFSTAEYNDLEYTIAESSTHRELYNTLLDSMRFTSLLANDLGYKHINYAQSGASQEGIKLQANLLIQYLENIEVDLTKTNWIIGLTHPYRVMMLSNVLDDWHKTLISRGETSEYIWSRYTVECLNPAVLHSDFSKQFVKEFLERFPPSNALLSWSMHVSDTRMLLEAKGIKNYAFINLFPTMKCMADTYDIPQIVFDQVNKNLHRLNNDDYIIPRGYVDMSHMLQLSRNKCRAGHYDKDGNRAIADYLRDKIFK